MTFMLVVNKEALLAFHIVCHVLFRDKTRSLGNKMLWKAQTQGTNIATMISYWVVWKVAIFLNVSCLWWHQRERTHTLLVALFVIRGYLGFLRPSRSRFTVWCLLRGWSVSLLEYFVKNWTWVIVFERWRVFFVNVNMAKIYEGVLFTNIPPRKMRD